MSEEPYNVRLYRRMLQAITDYQSKSLALRQLISNLEGLHGLLENPDENWSHSFYKSWIPLEEVYAVALDRAQSELDEQSLSIIRLSLDKLREVIESELA